MSNRRPRGARPTLEDVCTQWNARREGLLRIFQFLREKKTASHIMRGRFQHIDG